MRSTLAAAFLTLLLSESPIRGQGTAFTYHGQLTEAGLPTAGTIDLRVILFNAEIGGAQVGPIRTNLNVEVTQGVFATQLDFGAGVFNGEARWLDLAVRRSGSSSFVQLSPRQPISAAPYALYAMTPAGPQGPQGLSGPAGPQGPVGPQ
jgi:hypothetical protein